MDSCKTLPRARGGEMAVIVGESMGVKLAINKWHSHAAAKHVRWMPDSLCVCVQPDGEIVQTSSPPFWVEGCNTSFSGSWVLYCLVTECICIEAKTCDSQQPHV